MQNLFRISEIVINFVEAYILYRLNKGVLITKDKDKRVWHLLLVLGLGGLLTLKSISQWNKFEQMEMIIFVICLLVIFSYTFIFFVNKWTSKILIGLLYIISTAAVNALVMLLLLSFTPNISMQVFSESSIYRVSSEVIGKCLLLLCIEFFCRTKKRFVVEEKRISNAVILVIMIDFLLFIGLYIFYNNAVFLTNEGAFLFITLCVIFVTIIFMCIIQVLFSYYSMMMMERLKNQNMKMKLNTYEDMKKVTNNLRTLRHDMNNHIAVVYGLVETRQFAELQSYVERLYGTISLADNYVILPDETLSILISFKKTLAHEKGIHFNCSVMISSFCMESIDICSLFGNIIDNAIEAAEQLSADNREIELEMYETKDGWKFSCENTYRTQPVFSANGLISTKGDKEIHGIGSRNVKDIVGKYEGTLEYKTDERFVVSIFIPKNKKEVEQSGELVYN